MFCESTMQTPCLDHLAMKKVQYELRLFHSHSCGSDSKALSPELGASQGKKKSVFWMLNIFFSIIKIGKHGFSLRLMFTSFVPVCNQLTFH